VQSLPHLAAFFSGLENEFTVPLQFTLIEARFRLFPVGAGNMRSLSHHMTLLTRYVLPV
jgi:hypothetical protein